MKRSRLCHLAFGLSVLPLENCPTQARESDAKPDSAASVPAELDGLGDYFRKPPAATRPGRLPDAIGIRPAVKEFRPPSTDTNLKNPGLLPTASQANASTTPVRLDRMAASQRLMQLKLRANGLRSRIAQAQASEAKMKSLLDNKSPALSFALSSPFQSDYLVSENELLRVESEILELETIVNSR
jgi:hypothetical protein